jgi:FkbM family methyltransferase
MLLGHFRFGSFVSGRPCLQSQEHTLQTPRDATKEDIFYCFRLLLGRSPNREEWPGHSARAGMALEQVVASYCQSLEFARRGLTRQDLTSALVCSEIGGFKVYSDESDAGPGMDIRAGVYEPHVTAVFNQILKPGMNVVDIGANLGYFSPLSAKIVGAEGSVLAIEPNPRNVKLLEASRRLNGFDNITVVQVAAGVAPGLLILNTSYSNGTTSSLPGPLNDVLASEIVPCMPVDSLTDMRIDLIKADVEGAEYSVLRGAEGIITKHRPIIVSEFSPTMMPGISSVTGEEYPRWLTAKGYRLGVIEHDGAIVNHDTDTDAVMGAFEQSGVDHIDITAQPV